MRVPPEEGAAMSGGRSAAARRKAAPQLNPHPANPSSRRAPSLVADGRLVSYRLLTLFTVQETLVRNQVA